MKFKRKKKKVSAPSKKKKEIEPVKTLEEEHQAPKEIKNIKKIIIVEEDGKKTKEYNQ